MLLYQANCVSHDEYDRYLYYNRARIAGDHRRCAVDA